MENQQENWGEQLQDRTCGIHLSIMRPSAKLKLSDDQRQSVANLFRAQKDSVTADRRIINTRHVLVAPVLKAQSAARRFISERSIDFPEQNVRLCRLDQLPAIREGFAGLSAALNEALRDLDEGWPAIVQDGRERLEELFNPADYDWRPSDRYGMSLSFPSVKPDERFAKLDPQLYEQMQARMAARFEQAVVEAEAAAIEQVRGLLSNLSQRLGPDDEGNLQTVRSSTVEKLQEFCELFRTTSIGSDQALEDLVEQVSGLASGLDPKAIRKSPLEARASLKDELDQLVSEADQLLEVKPVRQFTFDDE
jgi:hypothetical protein